MLRRHHQHHDEVDAKLTFAAPHAHRNRNNDMVAPTPQNTPLSNAPLTREALSRPTVGTIGEEDEGAGELRNAAPTRCHPPASC